MKFVCLQVPNLQYERRQIRNMIGLNAASLLTLTVLSLLALTSNLESADHASRYTGATCPRKVATYLCIQTFSVTPRDTCRNVTYFPVRPSHILTEESQLALAAQRPSGLNAT